MPDTINPPQTNTPAEQSLHFGEEIEIEESGFSFRPLMGLELEIDHSVYMYTEDGNLEINLCGGELANKTSITELNNQLADQFLVDVDSFELVEAGTGTIQEIAGFQNEIRFINAEEEEGLGRALICSPYINQYFFILVIATKDYWQAQGEKIFKALKSSISFHPQFTPDLLEGETEKHPDLTIETYEHIKPDEEFLLTIEKGDVSFLLAARSFRSHEKIALTDIVSPGGEHLYQYDPETGSLSSNLCEQPYLGSHGEICVFFPHSSMHSLVQGNYRFGFTTESGTALQEVQLIIRSGRALEQQSFDLNFWVAVETNPFDAPEMLDHFAAEIRQALKDRMKPLNLSPGKIEFFHPAPDELTAFSTVNLQTDLADCSYMIAESVNNGRALSIGLVDQIISGDSTSPEKIDACTSGSPGMILAPASPHACILISWSTFEQDYGQLAEAIIQQLIGFSGIDTHDIQKNDGKVDLTRELAWRLRRHPLFYDAD